MSKIEIDADVILERLDAIEAKLALFGGTASGSNQSSTGADAAVGAARTKSNKEVDSGTETVFKSVAQDSDVNVQEGWSVFALESARRDREAHDLIVSQERKHKAEIDALTLQSIANNQNQSNLNNTLSIDRSWNLNETDAYSAIAATVTAAVLKELGKQE